MMDRKWKAAITLMSVIVMIALCGCGSKAAANTIGPWDTSDKQAGAAIEILACGGYSAFAGFDVDETYRSAKIGIEYYKDGELIDDMDEGTITIDAASQGIAGFNCRYGIATVGLSADGNTGSASDIQIPDYSTKDEELMSFAAMSESKDISDGQKIYLGIMNSGNDSLSTEMLDASYDKKGLVGKNWLFYVVFSSKPLE